MRADAGVVISASHNPYQDNGIKIFSLSGFKLPDADEDEIEDLITSGHIRDIRPTAAEIGKAHRIDDATGRYVVFCKSTFPEELSLEGMKIVLDCANGATYRAAPMIFSELGADVTAIHCEPDGVNINDRCGSQHPEDLRAKVLEIGADIGLAFDGDGDRLIAVDEKGEAITGDHIMVICARRYKDQDRLRNNLVISTVMSNFGFGLALKDLGIEYGASKVGDRYVLEMMQERGAVIGGEPSGHTIFLDRHTTGDGIVTALQLLAALRDAGKPLSEMAKLMQLFPQKVINVDVTRKPPLEELPEVGAAVKAAEAELGEKGRVLVRYSGTQSMCRVMVEGPTEEITQRLARQIADAVQKSLS
jgi:phosphoglucosamine mutase